MRYNVLGWESERLGLASSRAGIVKIHHIPAPKGGPRASFSNGGAKEGQKNGTGSAGTRVLGEGGESEKRGENGGFTKGCDPREGV
jgi:hypothetical protein